MRSSESDYLLREKYANDRATNTCDWLFSLESYHHWISAKDSPLLWISGSPGTGKSTLCSAIIDDLWRNEQQDDLVAFLLYGDRPDRFDAAQCVLDTLMYELRGYQQRGSKGGGSIVIPREIQTLSRPMLREEFQLKLRSILLSVNKEARMFLILDGLDHDEWIKEVVMAEIGEANLTRKIPNKFRCAIATQDLLEPTLSHCRVMSLDLDVEPGVRRDLQTFTVGGLATIIAKHTTYRVSVANLATRLLSRANGVFLWVTLVLERLDRIENLDELARAVDSTPSTVYGIYQEELRAIPAHDIDAVQKILSWLTVANRSLNLSELEEALKVEMELSHASAHTANHVARMESRGGIRRLCGNLVTIAKNGVVRLRHPTLRAHLLSESSSRAPRYPELEAHELVARACLRLLDLATKDNADMFGIKIACSGTTVTKSSLTEYAAANWSLHYRLAETYSRTLAGTLQRCLVLTLNNACDHFNISPSRRSVQIADANLRFSASHGFVSLTRMCLEMGTDPEAGSCKLCKTPFALAAASGQLETANLLLKHAISSTDQTRYGAEEMLHVAVRNRLTDKIKILLRNGAEVNTADPVSGQTLLHNAAASGDWILVGLLMDYNADVNAVIPLTLETPLHLAAVHGHLQVVRYLVDGHNSSEKEVETYDSIVQQPYYQSWTDDLLSEDGQTYNLVWEVGARDSAEDDLRKLFSWSGRYSDINLQTAGGLTALDLAASRGHEEIVSFLLKSVPMLQKPKKASYMALQVAAENGHMATVKLLLAAGADMGQRFETLATTLKRASKKGHDDVADLLVWHYFNGEISNNEKFSWPLLRVSTNSRHTIVRDFIQKTQGNKNRKKLHHSDESAAA